jgi:hypothetical protein
VNGTFKQEGFSKIFLEGESDGKTDLRASE